MFNFKSGTALAVQQDQYIPILTGGGALSAAQISEMEKDLWVIAAVQLAPSNLVIRQYCLIDLAKGTPYNRDLILRMMSILTYKNSGNYLAWGEGYSYFNYTMNALKPWISKFEATVVKSPIVEIVDKVKKGFIATSYLRGKKWYPAPIGDTRDEPLSQELQVDHERVTMTISNVGFNYNPDTGVTWYNIAGRPIGFNVHLPKDNYMVVIDKGMPAGFKFYEGYDKKYKSVWAELRDTYSYQRLKSFPF